MQFWRLLIEQIQQLALEKGWTADAIKIFEGDCWQHLSNVWFGAVTKQLSKTLSDVLENDLARRPSILCMSTEIDHLL